VYEDFPPGRNDLVLSWSCLVTGVLDNSSSISYGDSCDDLFALDSLDVNSLVLVPIKTSMMLHSVQYSFTAASNLVSVTSGRSVISATVDVQRRSPQLAYLPLVSIASTFKKFLPNKILKIRGVIQNLFNSTQGRARWELFNSQGASLPLTDLSITKETTLTLFANRSFYDFSLSLKPNSLAPGKTYTFRLAASVSFQSVDVMTYASLVVTGNSPPTGGQFLISPQHGITMETIFSFAASYWTDSPDDYPLSYSFFYSLTSSNSSSSQLMALGFASQRSYVNSFLPSGLKSQSYAIFALLQVSDVFGASSETEIRNNVTVFPAAAASSEQISAETINATMSKGFVSSNYASILQTINTFSSVMLVSDCDCAPECSLLNRDICFSTPHTCGSCVGGYVGIPEDSNVPCVVNDSYSDPFNRTCSSDNDCLPFHVCSSGRCDHPLKSCPSNS
jgi:hypothetical protein